MAQLLCVCCRQRPVADPWRPFCSERCKLEDLARWLDGRYRVPGQPVSPDARSDETVTEKENDSD